MLNLIIDQGNTTTKFFVFDKNYNIVYSTRCTNNDKANCKAVLESLLDRDIDSAIYSSVGEINEQILSSINNLNFYILFDHTTPIPIENLYQSKHTLGTDRLAGAIGANYLYPGKNLIIIDIGTAITYDFVTAQNQFIGGNISPGPHIRLKALSTFTSRLPLVDLKQPEGLIARNTQEAILNGVVYGIVAEINGIISMAKGLYSPLTPILTGGYADFFGKMFKNYIFVKANLVAIGLNRVLEFNKKLTL